MKKLIIIFFIVISKCQILFSQENNLVLFFTDAITNGVPVYSNDTSTDRITIIKEYSEKENWHTVIALLTHFIAHASDGCFEEEVNEMFVCTLSPDHPKCIDVF